MSLSGTSWINMDSGAFSFGNGALSYDGVAEQLTIGGPNSQIKTIYTAGRISFQQNGIEIAYISGEENKLFIRHIQVLETFGIGIFRLAPRANGNMSLKKVAN